jgi:3-(3-hydroxy-phenyl)propionate hydroxylase
VSRLVTSPNLPDPDGCYAALVAAHQGLTDAASELLNARLVLILANHVGDPQVLHEALALARAAVEPAPGPAAPLPSPSPPPPPPPPHPAAGETR